VQISQAEGAVRLAAAGLGIALVPDNIVLPAVDCAVLRLAPRVIRDVAVYARTEWSPTAAAFVDVLRAGARRRPAHAVAIQL
jgi:DNA-binding transcriptional LysR family regulator